MSKQASKQCDKIHYFVATEQRLYEPLSEFVKQKFIVRCKRHIYNKMLISVQQTTQNRHNMAIEGCIICVCVCFGITNNNVNCINWQTSDFYIKNLKFNIYFKILPLQNR